MNHTYFHIDVNSAFLSWEAVYRLKCLGEKVDIREQVSAIGGDIEKRHGIILAKSIPAKKYHIKTGESIIEAKQKCPQLLLYPPDYNLYEKCSYAFFKLLKEYTDHIEQYSIDEFFVDVTDILHQYSSAEDLAFEIKDRVKTELGFTVNVGISTNKLLAKQASDFQKPDRVHHLYPNEIQEKLWPLSSSDLFGVGHATKKKLDKLELFTIGDIATADTGLLMQHLKSYGLVIWQRANGIDESFVVYDAPFNKGYGNSTTTPFDVVNLQQASLILLGLAESVGMRVRRDEMEIRVVNVSVRYQESLIWASRQKTLKESTDITDEIYHAALELLPFIWDGKTPLRQLGIHTSGAQRKDGFFQLSFLGTNRKDKLREADKMADHIRQRYGKRVFMRASFLLDPRVDPLSGGISDEKRGRVVSSNL
ncbi:DNA polymerase IV [bacterium]|nr:DNA polymerase IV [bacterium]MDY2885352.1 DNA polymerase IV [Bariatricus sp.]